MGEKTFWEAAIFLGVRINEPIKSKIEEKSHTQKKSHKQSLASKVLEIDSWLLNYC